MAAFAVTQFVRASSQSWMILWADVSELSTLEFGVKSVLTPWRPHIRHKPHGSRQE